MIKPPLQRKRDKFTLRLSKLLYPSPAIKKALDEAPFPITRIGCGKDYEEFELKTSDISDALKWSNYLFLFTRIKHEAKR
ncbi:MAG: hypothetical protein D4S01_03990 [Dehalococcoidia bacterium]|nr:MAG: hypothetical protein D4S01_03990 [Dehalococcoidia bacterium]